MKKIRMNREERTAAELKCYALSEKINSKIDLLKASNPNAMFFNQLPKETKGLRDEVIKLEEERQEILKRF